MKIGLKIMDTDTGDLYTLEDLSFPPYCPICSRKHQLHWNKYEQVLECRITGRTFKYVDTENLRKQLLLLKRMLRINTPKNRILKQIDFIMTRLL